MLRGVPRESNTRPNLTEQQTVLLSFVATYIKEHGYPPSVRECCAATRLRATSSVHHQLWQLQLKGYITRTPTISRGITLHTDMKDIPHE